MSDEDWIEKEVTIEFLRESLRVARLQRDSYRLAAQSLLDSCNDLEKLADAQQAELEELNAMVERLAKGSGRAS